jgi:glycosyltransferase involved in cell wall biosynthesis
VIEPLSSPRAPLRVAAKHRPNFHGTIMRLKDLKSPPLRVAHVTLGLEIGGQEKLLVEFARCADHSRFDLHFVALGGRGVLARDLEAWGWPVTALGEPSGFRPGLVLRLAGLFREQSIDVVHTHDERPHIYGAFAARLAGVQRLIHTRHHGMADRLTPRQTGLVRLASELTDRFVCVSADSAHQAGRQGVSPRTIRVLRNGIDLTRFDPAPTPSSPTCGGREGRGDGPVVVVARLSPEKDITTLLHAASLALREDAAFQLEIAGDGPCMADLRRTAGDLGLNDCVRFHGQVRDVPALLRRAGLFVLPSLTEGVSLTLLEAMASGLAVVATRVGGNPEVVADGETGLLVPPRDPAALAAALLRLRRDRCERRRMEKAGRRRVERCFDVRRMTTAYEKMYLGLDGPAGRLRAGAMFPAGVNDG